jgi:hypothetical protein
MVISIYIYIYIYIYKYLSLCLLQDAKNTKMPLSMPLMARKIYQTSSQQQVRTVIVSGSARAGRTYR